MNVDRAWTGAYRAGALLSFQRRRRETPVWSASVDLENCTRAKALPSGGVFLRFVVRGCAARRYPSSDGTQG